MSRSYKKTPGWTCGTDKKWIKRLANKRVRKTEVPNGNAYKKVYQSYDICDYKFLSFVKPTKSEYYWYTLQDQINDYEKSKRK